MKFEEILPHIRAGKKVRYKEWGDTFIQFSPEKKVFQANLDLSTREIMAQDGWELHEEETTVAITESQFWEAAANSYCHNYYPDSMKALAKRLGFGKDKVE